MQPSPPRQSATAGEIAAIVLAALLVIAGTFLLVLHIIDVAYALSIYLLAVGILAANVALKVPSPAQQQQFQGLFTQIMDVLPGLVQRAQQPPQVIVQNHIPPLPTAPTSPVPQQPFPAPQFPPRFSQQVPTPGQ